MSWLTQILRDVGLGNVLNAIEMAEKMPSAANIGTAITTAVAAAPTAIGEGAPATTLLIDDVGTAAGKVVAQAAAKVSPEATVIQAAVVPGLLAAIEQAAEAFLKAETGGLL